MNEFLAFLKEIFLFKENDALRVGLSSFDAAPVTPPQRKKPSINTKNVKLSDLMRRAD